MAAGGTTRFPQRNMSLVVRLTWQQVLAAKALKQQQQQKKQQLQEAASATADAVKQAVLQQQVEAIEADEAQEEKIMEKLRRIGRCPAGVCAVIRQILLIAACVRIVM